MTGDELLDSFYHSCYKNLTRVRNPARLTFTVTPTPRPWICPQHTTMCHLSQLSHTGRCCNARALYYLCHSLFQPLCVRLPESGTCLDASVNPKLTAGRLARKNEARRTRVQIGETRGRINDGSLPRVSVSLPLVPSHFCQLAAPHPFLLTATLQFTLQRIHQCP